MKKLAVLAVIAGLAAGIMTGCGGTQRNADAAAQMTGQGNGTQQTAVQSGKCMTTGTTGSTISRMTGTRRQMQIRRQSDQDQAAQQPAATEDEQKEAALQTALADAGVNEADASRIRVTIPGRRNARI